MKNPTTEASRKILPVIKQDMWNEGFRGAEYEKICIFLWKNSVYTRWSQEDIWYALKKLKGNLPATKTFLLTATAIGRTPIQVIDWLERFKCNP